jgi:hypothetical protein
MNQFKKYLKTELDTEIFACVHAMSMIFIYGLALYFYGIKAISFAIIFQMLVLGYLISWTQKLLFLKDRIYKKIEYKVRVILWSVLPIVWTFIFGIFFGWYTEHSIVLEIIFLFVMICYYIILWVLLQLLYKEDSDELNKKLVMFKQKNIRKEV